MFDLGAEPELLQRFARPRSSVPERRGQQRIGCAKSSAGIERPQETRSGSRLRLDGGGSGRFSGGRLRIGAEKVFVLRFGYRERQRRPAARRPDPGAKQIEACRAAPEGKANPLEVEADRRSAGRWRDGAAAVRSDYRQRAGRARDRRGFSLRTAATPPGSHRGSRRSRRGSQARSLRPNDPPGGARPRRARRPDRRRGRRGLAAGSAALKSKSARNSLRPGPPTSFPSTPTVSEGLTLLRRFHHACPARAFCKG